MISEFDIIQRYFAPLSAKYLGAFNLTDDAAVLDIPTGYSLASTTDALTAGVHFFPTDDPFLLGQKIVAVNVSDLASMGATPLAYSLALHLPNTTSTEWLEAFSCGLSQACNQYGGALIGGDTTTHSGMLCMSLTALGTLPLHYALRRNGAQVGDGIYVSNTIGDSYAGLQYLLKRPGLPSLSSVHHQFLLQRYHTPTARISLGTRLRTIATSCIDISDGLIADLTHICNASRVGARITLEHIPFSEAAQASDISALELITGGDDYELLFTMPPEQLSTLAPMAEIAITQIGTITKKSSNTSPVLLLNEAGQNISVPNTGYLHQLVQG